RNLTDEDGPYIELMTGVFTDNQPDFSWLQPNEEKSFEQYFMPYTLVGQVKNATKEAMLNLQWEGDTLHVKVYTTSDYPGARVLLLNKGQVVKEWTRRISPQQVFEETHLPAEKGSQGDWALVVTDAQNQVLVAWQDSDPGTEKRTIPAPATAAPAPADIAQVEDLYLNGLHLEQYRHATYNPIDYYAEGLRRSPEDIRCNNAMGLLLLRRGQFEAAEPHFRRAIASLTRRNPNPYDGEPYYNLGWSLKLQGRLEEAFDAFYKATWNDAWQHSGFLSLARIATAQHRYKEALELVERSLVRNYHSPVARHLKAVLLRKTQKAAEPYIMDSLTLDPFNFGCLFEQGSDQFDIRMRGSLNNYLELALDYAQAGLYEDADTVLQRCPANSPLLGYYRGWFASLSGQKEAAIAHYRTAAKTDPACCFPNKIEEVLILRDAQKLNPADARAPYYLGNLWYDKRQYTDAVACWEDAARLDPTFPTVLRNLALAYYNKLNKKEAALTLLEKAFHLDTADARVLMELDQLYKIMGRPFEERLRFLEQYPDLIHQRDDLFLERITLCNQLKEYRTAQQLLASRKFHPWEGGEGKVVGQYLLCHLELAKQAIATGHWQEALQLLASTGRYPENLGEGKLYGTQENDRFYLQGLVYEKLGQPENARENFHAATVGISQPAQAIYYNDPQPDKIVYQALSWFRLGQREKALRIFESFIRFGKEHLDDSITIDYFAVSLPDMLVFDQDINRRNRIHCTYLIGLGHLGLGDEAAAHRYLHEVLRLDRNHQGAAVYLDMVPFFRQAIKQEPAC
ncbi:MAG TPA: tetratricopeptide repeat protein, partial [Puia sp.]|nr:tetratricopeptide repeat protein [Puia sp.]